MPAYTAQVLISKSLTDLGILEQGGTPNVSDSNAMLTLLNFIVQQWHLKNLFIWQIVSTNWPLSANVGTYTIGPAGTFNGPRPTYIEEAYINFVGPGTNVISTPLNLLSAKQYNDINDLSATAELPQGLYNDRASPLSTLALYPKPRCTVVTTLQLLTWAQLASYATLATSADLPDGYAEALTAALALRAVPMFGAAAPGAVIEVIRAVGLAAEKSIAELNVRARGIESVPEAAEAETQ